MVQAIKLGIHKLDTVKIISSHAYPGHVCTRGSLKPLKYLYLNIDFSQRSLQRLSNSKTTSTTSIPSSTSAPTLAKLTLLSR